VKPAFCYLPGCLKTACRCLFVQRYSMRFVEYLTSNNMGMSQHDVSFLGSKKFTFRGIKDTLFWDIIPYEPKKKMNHVHPGPAKLHTCKYAHIHLTQWVPFHRKWMPEIPQNHVLWVSYLLLGVYTHIYLSIYIYVEVKNRMYVNTHIYICGEIHTHIYI
jgi:hypothetical protein